MPKITALRLSEVAYERILEGLFQRRVEVGAFMSQSNLPASVDSPVPPVAQPLTV